MLINNYVGVGFTVVEMLVAVLHMAAVCVCSGAKHN
jgi:hypothetical protein